jgi:hypothetical protein
MPNIELFFTKVADQIKHSPRIPPSTVTILRDHIAENQTGALNSPFVKDQHYFHVVINEMFLSEQRKWFAQIDPAVYVVADFMYNGDRQVVPLVVGPDLLSKAGVPDGYNKGIIVRNTSVTGLKPYRGGGLILTVVLCECQVGNYVRPLLRVVESAAKALDFSPVLSPYVKVADVVMDGFESLFSAGGIKPIAGLRDSYGPSFNIQFQPAYFALIDAPNVDPALLWVSNNQLLSGPSLKAATPYRQADFVLYSFVMPAGNTRDDDDALSFSATWKAIEKLAAQPADDPYYKSAKDQMVALYQTMVTSPDLTDGQAFDLADSYAGRMVQIHERAKKFANLEGAKGLSDEADRLTKARQRLLNLPG